MKLSIIIPTFNSSAVLGRALDSIVNQTFTDWEVLIMDGASTDNTVEIAQSYNDPRIRIYSESDKGIYDAMNKGIKKAKGEWLYFLGSDDWLLVTDVLKKLFSHDIVQYHVIYGDVEATHLSSLNQGEWTLSTIDYNRCHQCIFYRYDVFKKLGCYDLKYPVWADYDFNLKWFFSKRIKKLYIPLPIAHFSMGGFCAKKIDYQFSKFLPYMKLTRGWNYYSREERRELIRMAMKRKSRKYPMRWFITIIMRAINL